MTPKQIYDMAQDAGSIDSEEVIMTFANAIRSATKEEDAGICDSEPERQNGDMEYVSDHRSCAAAIRDSK